MQLSPDSDPQGKLPTFLDFSELMAKGYMSAQAFSGQILEEVKYTNDISKLEPNVVRIDGESVQLNIECLGRYKNTHWAFQEEWRYIMTFMSMNFKVGVDMMSQLFNLSVTKMAQGKEAPPFRYFDLDIDPLYFAEMEIVCSPQMTVGNRILLETLVEKYNPSATIRESELLNLI